MKKLALIVSISIVGLSACKKDEEVEPVPTPDPIEYPIPDGPLEDFPIVTPDEAMIINYEEMDGTLYCPTDILALEVSSTMPILKVAIRGFYVSGVTGDSTLMWTKEGNGVDPVVLEYYDFAEAEIDAVVYGEYDTVQTLGFKPLGYDFKLPIVTHMEHPLIFSGNNFETTLECIEGDYFSYQWTKDYMDIPGEKGTSYVATEAGFYDVVTTPHECPDYKLKAGANVEVVRIEDSDIKQVVAVVEGNKISVTNTDDLEYETYLLLDSQGQVVFKAGAVYSGVFTNMAPGSYEVVASFWGNDWYAGLGEIARVSQAHTKTMVTVN